MRENWHLRLVGTMEVRTAAVTWRPAQVGSRKARTVLALLGARGHRLVAVDSVVDAVWGGAPPRRPEAGVATLVSRLRSKFGPEMILGGRTGYRLGDTVRVDLHEAAVRVAEAEDHPGRRGLAAAQRAVDLLDGGPALVAHPAVHWADQARALQEALLRRAWHAAAASALATGSPGRARALAETAIAADGLDEAAYRILMCACVATGEPGRAVVSYHRLRTTLAVELGTDPSAATQELYVSMLQRDCNAARHGSSVG